MRIFEGLVDTTSQSLSNSHFRPFPLVFHYQNHDQIPALPAVPGLPAGLVPGTLGTFSTVLVLERQFSRVEPTPIPPEHSKYIYQESVYSHTDCSFHAALVLQLLLLLLNF